MKIYKVGHCCLIIEHKGLKVMTDPGYWISDTQVKDIDIILITHEHSDHMHIGTIKKILLTNPNAKVFTNTAVSLYLKNKHIPFKILENYDSINIKDVLIEAVEGKHEELWGDIMMVQNTGYMIDSKFFYPGDSFTVPKKKVEILAAPINGPWNSVKTCLEYILKVRPRYVIPVHDGPISKTNLTFFYTIPFKICGENFIKFIDMKNDAEMEFE